MSDPIFLPPAVTLTLREIARVTETLAPNGADLDRTFRNIASLETAGALDVSVCEGEHGDLVGATYAGACIVTRARASALPSNTLALITDRPAQAVAAMIVAFYPLVHQPRSILATRGISPGAFIHPEARLESDVTVDPGVVIGPKVEIGSGTTIGANTVIGTDVRIGRNCTVGAHVTIERALIGNAVVIQPGVRIGQNGADAAQRPDQSHLGLGRVIVQDGVRIGANSTIDRGGLGDTVLGEGCLIGNLLHLRRDQRVDRRETWMGQASSVAS